MIQIFRWNKFLLIEQFKINLSEVNFIMTYDRLYGTVPQNKFEWYSMAREFLMRIE